jgi:hypothetical protein
MLGASCTKVSDRIKKLNEFHVYNSLKFFSAEVLHGIEVSMKHCVTAL